MMQYIGLRRFSLGCSSAVVFASIDHKSRLASMG